MKERKHWTTWILTQICLDLFSNPEQAWFIIHLVLVLALFQYLMPILLDLNQGLLWRSIWCCLRLFARKPNLQCHTVNAEPLLHVYFIRNYAVIRIKAYLWNQWHLTSMKALLYIYLEGKQVTAQIQTPVRSETKAA